MGPEVPSYDEVIYVDIVLEKIGIEGEGKAPPQFF